MRLTDGPERGEAVLVVSLWGGWVVGGTLPWCHGRVPLVGVAGVAGHAGQLG